MHDMRKVKLNKQIYVFLMAACFAIKGMGQTTQFNLQQGSSIFFNHKVYCFGIAAIKQDVKFMVYQCDASLKVLDSFSIELPKNSINNYLNFHADTLHQFLNIYLQEKNTKHVDILRLNHGLNLHCHLKKVEVARLNNSALLGEQALLLKNTAFVIKSVIDSTGAQYYLNKYALKSDKENFDYQLKWQYPFERKHIQFVEFLKVDTQYIQLHVKILKGAKAGQYYLKIDANSGQLLKATKISEGAESHYMPGVSTYFSAEKSIRLMGQKLISKQYKPELNYVSAAGETAVLLYSMLIDSIGEISERREFKIPIKELTSGNNKTNQLYLLKMVKATRLNSGNIEIEFDVFKNDLQQIKCFYYCQSQTCNLKYDGEKYNLDNTLIQSNLEIENFYRTNDKLNMNGKLCLDSVYKLYEVYGKKLNMPVKLNFKSDAFNNGNWLLSKNDVLKKQIVISYLAPKDKIYQLKTIENIASDKNPHILFPNTNNFILGYQPDEKIFQLWLKQW